MYEYMTERIMNAPEEMLWPRSDNASYPYGIHEEIGLQIKILMIIGLANQIFSVLIITILAISLYFDRKSTLESE